MLWFMIGFKFSCVCVFFKQHLFVGRGKNETFLIWKVAYENYRLVQPDSEDFWSTLKLKCHKAIFQRWLKYATSFSNTTKCKLSLKTFGVLKCLSLKMIYFLQSGNRNKNEGAPKGKCNLPLSQVCERFCTVGAS